MSNSRHYAAAKFRVNSEPARGPTLAKARGAMVAEEDAEDDVYYLFIARGVAGKAPSTSVFAEHGAHLAKLDQEGKLALAGPFLDRFGGAIVLRVANLEEARLIAEEDPMVRGGFETYELIPWKQATQRNHYLPKLEQR